MYSKLTFISLIATFGLLACNQDVKKHCCDTGSQSFISDSVKVYVPDAFTPNGDGINDIFTYYINKPEAFVMHRFIVSKGNVLAFDKQDTAKIVWDGLIDGKKSKGKCIELQTHPKTGKCHNCRLTCRVKRNHLFAQRRTNLRHRSSKLQISRPI